MKILHTIDAELSYGGVVPYIEDIMAGFKTLGHETELVQLGKPKAFRNVDKSVIGEGSGLWLGKNINNGWFNAPRIDQHGIPNGWASQWDLVFHHTPTVRMNKSTQGDSSWIDVWERAWTKQVAVIHSSNFATQYPHLLHVREHIEAALCVHDAAFGGCKALDGVRRRMIPNPFDVSGKPFGEPPSKRDQIVGSVAMWRPSKRLLMAVQTAIALADFGVKYEIVGEGIDRYKMASPTKCPDEFRDEEGNRFWDTAVNLGMRWFKYKHYHEIYEWMRNLVFHIDFTRDNTEYAWWNRTSLEAAISGCIPVVHEDAMVLGEEGTISDVGLEFIILGKEQSEQSIAKTINDLGWYPQRLDEIAESNREAMKQFQRESIAQGVLDFVLDPKEGELGVEDDKVWEKAEANLWHFV